MNDFDFTQVPRAPVMLYQYYNYASFLYIANGGTNDISVFASIRVQGGFRAWEAQF